MLARKKWKIKQKYNEQLTSSNTVAHNAPSACRCHLCELYSLQSKHAESKRWFASHAILSTLSGMCFGINDVFFHKWCWYAKRKKYLRGAVGLSIYLFLSMKIQLMSTLRLYFSKS